MALDERWTGGRWARALAAEAAGTALLVWLGLGSLLADAAPPLVAPALAFGGAVAALAAASGAHLNPAVSLAAALARRLAPLRALALVPAQLLGAVLGAAAALGAAPGLAAHAAHGGCTLPAEGVGAAWAVAVEASLTAALVLTLCAAWAARRPDPELPLRLGFVVAGLVFAGGGLTGASLNPARSFGPALLRNYWAYHWVYWVGPLLGAALATMLHRYVLAEPASEAPEEPEEPPSEAPEELPLRDKAEP